MATSHFTTAILVNKMPSEVFKAVNNVRAWWSMDFEGNSTKLNDEFVIHHPKAHYSKQQLIEIIPDKKIVWLVIDSMLHWLQKDKHEWTNTKMIFELNTKADKTILHFTHQGLVTEKECYQRCEQGWKKVINDRLFNFISYGKSL